MIHQRAAVLVRVLSTDCIDALSFEFISDAVDSALGHLMMSPSMANARAINQST